MFNLIPDSLKEEIREEYIHRRIVVWFFIAFIFVCAFSIFLLPSYVYIFFEEKNISADVELIKNSAQFKKGDEVTRTIIETNNQLEALSYTANTIDPIGAIQNIIEIKNQSIQISEIEYSELTASSSMITLKGLASKREVLKKFVTDLQSVKVFKNVSLPVSNFVKDKDIDFTISITVL